MGRIEDDISHFLLGRVGVIMDILGMTVYLKVGVKVWLCTVR